MNELTLEFFFHFMFVFARLGTAFSWFPALGSAYIPTRFKLVFALATTLVMLPMLTPYLPKYSSNTSIIISYIAIEIFIGLIISFAANIYFHSIHFVGQIISMQSGLGSAAFFDPKQQSQVALISNFLVLLTISYIFASDTHYLFLKAIAESYSKFSAGELLDSGDVSKFVSQIVNDSFVLSFKLSSPFLIVSLAMMTGNGLLARLMPNFQVFFVITPAQILAVFYMVFIMANIIVEKLVLTIGSTLNIQGI